MSIKKQFNYYVKLDVTSVERPVEKDQEAVIASEYRETVVQVIM